ncbi:hypothetical protein J421_0046 [Gemmatirosa kalamazoonensis]|uniref:Uncharacterized protein n=1 Tax=Gemmatirosa kalamazoonensis TaxID=861299 RepID=W0RAS2_9BACT|nr:hypothetical protein [Gemmatirosa kalamazoonensis]AHG87539.1 hypothetical protein J421_0001 [Gemmatirosa kalamazoonensis]AHG87562.1 hypothetical protein J421_0024 [Gemmatirosa kalamazoonensis]AHG87583.1 hypothetical protein J421_0046 [Gemmatirosa kalamazoonensis]
MLRHETDPMECEARGVYVARLRVGGRVRVVAMGHDGELVAECYVAPCADVWPAIDALRTVLDTLDPPRRPALGVVRGCADASCRARRRAAAHALSLVGR